MSETTILTGFLPIIAALIVAALGYVKNASSTSAEDFDLVKFGATVIVGGGVTVVMYLTGQPISSESIAVQIVAYSGLIVIVENGIKVLTRGAVRIPSSWIAAFLPEATKASAVAVPASTGSGSAVPAANVAAAGVHDLGVPTANTGSETKDKDDTISMISMKAYPDLLTGVSPFKAEYLIVCDPSKGVHAPVKCVVDHGDGVTEEIPVKNGVAHVVHQYEYNQALTLVENAPSQYYSKVFYPHALVIGADGLRGEMNNLNKNENANGQGASLIITVKDAAAVAAGKV